MDYFSVKTKLGDLTFKHEQNRVTVTGSMDALADWWYRYGQILYGAFGHVFKVDNCSVCDVYAALTASYGSKQLTVSDLTKEKCNKQLRSIPPELIP